MEIDESAIAFKWNGRIGDQMGEAIVNSCTEEINLHYYCLLPLAYYQTSARSLVIYC
jgi:hypothetical protein